jgi:hypothetical protein
LSRQRYKVTFLLDKSNLWIEKYLKKYNFKFNNKYIFKIKKNPNLVKNQDLVFPLAYTKILSENFGSVPFLKILLILIRTFSPSKNSDFIFLLVRFARFKSAIVSWYNGNVAILGVS